MVGVRAFIGLLTFAVGCGPELQQSDNAVSLQAVDEDDREEKLDESSWPGFRGWQSQGISPAEHLPTDFSPSAALWKIDVPAGNSSPIAWGDRVWLAVASGDSPVELGLHCYNRRDGSLRWEAEIATTELPAHGKNGHASATPVTDGRNVYVSFGDPGLFAFDDQGKQLWHAELGPLEHEWGTASSPVLYKDTVIQLCDSDTNSFLLAVDRSSGEQRWRIERESVGAWSTPVVIEAETVDGATRDELVVNGTGVSSWSSGEVIAYNPAGGDVLWRHACTTTIVNPSPIVARDMVYSTSGRNGPIVALRPGGTGTLDDSSVVWRRSKGGSYVPTGVAYRNRLYLVSDGGVLVCYNAGDGSVVWQKRLGGNFTASLVAGAGMVIAVNERGRVFVIRAGDEFEEISRKRSRRRLPGDARHYRWPRPHSHRPIPCFASERKPRRSRLPSSRKGWGASAVTILVATSCRPGSGGVFSRFANLATSRLYISHPRHRTMSTITPELESASQQAREALDEHVRKTVHWHFHDSTGCPFWLEKKAGLGFDPLKDVQGFDDLKKFPLFEDDWLRGGPVRRWVPQKLANKATYVFETGGTTGVPKSRVVMDDFRIDYELFSDTLPDEYFPKGSNWLMLGPSGPRRLRLAVEHLCQHRGGICFCVDLDPRWVVKLLKRGAMQEAELYKKHCIDQALVVLGAGHDVRCMFTTPKLLEALALALEEQGSSIAESRNYWHLLRRDGVHATIHAVRL